jgi:hypothetical protein
MIPMVAFVACTRPTTNPDSAASEHTAWRADRDGDGFDGVEDDCDDSDASTFPGAPDPEQDGRDQDCDGGDGVTPLFPGTRIDGPPGRWGFGSALAVGPWDGVAGDDIVIGCDDEPPGGEVDTPHEGVVQVRSASGGLLEEWVGETRQLIGQSVALVAGGVYTATGNGDGTLFLPNVGAPSQVLDDSGGLSSGDMDGDGIDELALGTVSETTVRWAPYDTTAPRVVLQGPSDAALVAREAGGAAFVQYLLGEGRLEWWDALAPGAAQPPTHTWTVDAVDPHFAAGDLDGDGVEEVVVTSAPNVGDPFVLALEPGEDAASASVSLHLPPAFTGWPGPRNVQVADLDGDGQADLALHFWASKFQQGRLAVWFGPLGPGGDLAAPDLAWRGEPESDLGRRLVVGDVNADGHVDLVAGAPNGTVLGGGAVYVLEGPFARP